MLELRPDDLATVRRLLARHVPEAEVWAYGSRVAGQGHEGSDLDLVVRNPADPRQPLPNLGPLRDALGDSDLPFVVDVFDWARLPEGFRRQIAGDHEVLQAPRPASSRRPAGAGR